MNKLLLVIMLTLVSMSAMAQEVVSRYPVYERQYSQQCVQDNRRDLSGAIIGAVVGYGMGGRVTGDYRGLDQYDSRRRYGNQSSYATAIVGGVIGDRYDRRNRNHCNQYMQEVLTGYRVTYRIRDEQGYVRNRTYFEPIPQHGNGYYNNR